MADELPDFLNKLKRLRPFLPHQGLAEQLTEESNICTESVLGVILRHWVILKRHRYIVVYVTF